MQSLDQITVLRLSVVEKPTSLFYHTTFKMFPMLCVRVFAQQQHLHNLLAVDDVIPRLASVLIDFSLRASPLLFSLSRIATTVHFLHKTHSPRVILPV